MYADGKGEVIKRAEYLRWKYRDQGQVSNNIFGKFFITLHLLYLIF